MSGVLWHLTWTRPAPRLFGESLLAQRPGADFTVAASLEELLSECPMVAFGTTAIKPYVDDLDACPAGATILHVSLRDLSAGAFFRITTSLMTSTT